jgi:UDP-2-acetamido-3-amino-2,3-dideoxy-glucuronate N-acetyltransferase
VSSLLRPAAEAVGLVLGEGVRIGEGVLVGAGVVVEDGTIIGDGCVLEHGAVLGKRPRLARTSSASRETPPPLELGRAVTVCTGAVVYAGARLADEAIVGDGAQVRERSTIGAGSVVGRAASVDNDVVVGARVSLQTNVYVAGSSVIEDDVFLGPGASTTNDDTMNRHGREHALRGATIRRAARVGGSAILVPGVEIGEEAFVAAGAVVTGDVRSRAFMVGVPARHVRDVSDADLLERWR